MKEYFSNHDKIKPNRIKHEIIENSIDLTLCGHGTVLGTSSLGFLGLILKQNANYELRKLCNLRVHVHQPNLPYI